MNKERRQAIAEVKTKLGELRLRVEELREEQDAYVDNMPRGFLQSDRGMAAEVAAGCLWAAHDAIEEAIKELEEAVSI
jgi:hypothetical protein